MTERNPIPPMPDNYDEDEIIDGCRVVGGNSRNYKILEPIDDYDGIVYPHEMHHGNTDSTPNKNTYSEEMILEELRGIKRTLQGIKTLLSRR